MLGGFFWGGGGEAAVAAPGVWTCQTNDTELCYL